MANSKEKIMEKNKEFSLPKKKVVVKPLIKSTPFIPDTNHVSSFLSPGAKRRYVVPIRRDGKFKNILSNEEKEYFENSSKSGLDFEPGDLSVYKKDGFWDSFEVFLDKNSLTLDLSRPFDYFKYLVLKANTKEIAPSMASVRMRSTYKYVLVDEEVQNQLEARSADSEELAWEKFGQIKNNRSIMMNVLSVYGRSASETSTDDFLKSQIKSIIKSTNGIEKFLNIVNDPDFDIRLLIKNAIATGSLTRSKGSYYLEGGDRIGLTLEDTIEYLKDPMNHEVLVKLETLTSSK